MQKCEGSVFWRECLWKFKCDVRHNSCLYKKKQMKRRSEVEDASSRKSKRRPLANRRAGFLLFKRAVSFLEGRPPFSKAGIAQNHEAGDLSGRVVTRHVRLGALRKPRAEPGFEPRFSKDHHSCLSSLAGSFAEITGRFVRKRVTGTVHPSTGCRQIVRE